MEVLEVLMYVRLINGKIEYCPSELIEESNLIIGYTDEFLRERGYKPLVYSECKEDEQKYSCRYEDKGDYILQIWT